MPFWSVVTLMTELGVTAVVFFVIWRAATTGRFSRLLAFGVLAYEVLFNISYMVSRAGKHVSEVSEGTEPAGEIALAIFHGTFSLLMFVSLIVFFLTAARAYARGENYFAAHRPADDGLSLRLDRLRPLGRRLFCAPLSLLTHAPYPENKLKALWISFPTDSTAAWHSDGRAGRATGSRSFSVWRRISFPSASISS